MGKNMTKKKQKAREQRQRKYLRVGILSLLVVLGLGTMIGMATFNANVRPQRDMKWYVRDEAVQALSMLGFPPAPSAKVVSQILTEQPELPVEQVIKLALKMIK